MKGYKNKETLSELYKEYKSAYKIAEILDCNEKTIYRWMKKFEIIPQDKTQGARKHNCNHDYFSIIDSEEKAYWLGFIMADGCVYKGDSKGSYRLQINLCRWDREMLESFNTAINSDYEIDDKSVGYVPVSQLKINSTKMCNDLMNLGVVPRKSKICELPNIDEQYYSHFMRGYFEGDGCITGKERRWKMCIVSGSEKMMDDMEQLLNKSGIDMAVYESHFKPGNYSLETTKHETLIKFYEYMYNDANFYMQRKKDKYDECLSLICPVLQKCKTITK